MSYLYLIAAFVLNASANIFLKLGAERGFDFSSFSPLTLLSRHQYFLIGCLLFVCNVPLYFLSLKTLPLSFAYPIMVVMSFVLVSLYATLVLKEPISTLSIIGYILMFTGLLLVVLKR